MNDEVKIRAVIADECELESMADSIIAALALHGYRIVPSPLEDWRRTQFKPLPRPIRPPDPCPESLNAGGSTWFCEKDDGHADDHSFWRAPNESLPAAPNSTEGATP